MWHFLISVNVLNNLNINSRSMRFSASQFIIWAINDWYSGGRVFDPWSGHIPFVETGS